MSLKQGLLLIVVAALLPLTASSIFQSVATWNSMEQSAITSLRANTKALAERERDPFLVASRLMVAATANADIRNMTAGCSDVLTAGFKGYDGIVNFVRTDAEGAVRCSLLPFAPGISLAGEEWWEKTKNAQGTTVSQLVKGPVSQAQVVMLAVPMKDAGGKFLGTFSAGIDVSKLRTSITRAPEAKAGVVAIVASNGKLVAGSTASIPFALPIDPVGDKPGVIETSDGGKWIFDAVPLIDRELYVLYAQPNAEIMSAASSQFRASILWPIAAILFASLAIWFGTNRLAIRWLLVLRKLSDEFSMGNFTGSRQAFANAPRELAELSDDLHNMAQVVESRTKELTDALQAKTELTREVHHRVKNNLQIVTSLLTMQASRMADDKAQSALRQSRSRIAALALIHRLIYEKDADHERGDVAVENLMGELCGQLRSANPDRRNIEFDCDTENFAIPMDLAVPLALFTVEAVTNSYRHAFADGTGGRIKLMFSRDGGDAVVSVQDNGKGYDAQNSSGAEMGSELMQAFTSQLNGTVTFSSAPGEGSLTILRFPLLLPVNESTGRRVS